MSHTTTIKALAIKDANAIRQAVERMQAAGTAIELVENGRPRMYYERQAVPCDFVLKLGGQYDVGLQKQADGTYQIIMDEWGNHVSNVIGAACPLPQTSEERALWAIGQFAQQYGRCAAVNAAVAQGYMVQSDYVDADGNVQLEIVVN